MVNPLCIHFVLYFNMGKGGGPSLEAGTCEIRQGCHTKRGINLQGMTPEFRITLYNTQLLYSEVLISRHTSF